MKNAILQANLLQSICSFNIFNPEGIEIFVLSISSIGFQDSSFAEKSKAVSIEREDKIFNPRIRFISLRFVELVGIPIVKLLILEIESELASNMYANIIDQILHPAGMFVQLNYFSQSVWLLLCFQPLIDFTVCSSKRTFK